MQASLEIAHNHTATDIHSKREQQQSLRATNTRLYEMITPNNLYICQCSVDAAARACIARSSLLSVCICTQRAAFTKNAHETRDMNIYTNFQGQYLSTDDQQTVLIIRAHLVRLYALLSCHIQSCAALQEHLLQP
jgi:hypothetical protein